MELKQVRTERPDGILFVLAYFLMLGAGFVFLALTLLVTAVPYSLQMARGDSFFFGGFFTVLMLAIAALFFGGWILWVARELWRDKPSARRSAVVLAALIFMMSLLSGPSFVFAYGNNSNMLVAALAMALIVGASSMATLWYLMRPHVKQFFG